MGRVGWNGSWRGWGRVGHAVKQPKHDSPQNQDLTQPKSILEGVQNPSFEYKNNFYYFIIIIVLYSQLYQKIITRCSWHKKLQWHNYYISSKRKKAERLPVFSVELKCFLPKQLQTKTCLLPHYLESS